LKAESRSAGDTAFTPATISLFCSLPGGGATAAGGE
jgi:hypothetical protein